MSNFPIKYPEDENDVYKFLVIMLACVLLLGFVSAFFFAFLPKAHAAEFLQASWYSRASLIKEGTWKHSKGVMANGRVFDENLFTCATRLYPLGSRLRITNLQNHKSVIVETTDRIGRRFAYTRIDLSKAAFAAIADCKQGLVPVRGSEMIYAHFHGKCASCGDTWDIYLMSIKDKAVLTYRQLRRKYIIHRLVCVRRRMLKCKI